MASFNDIINTLIPWLIGIIGIWLFIHILHEPLGALWGAIKSVFGRFKGGDGEETHPGTGGYIQYE